MTWTYLGERPGNKHKRVAVWRDDSTNESLAWKATPNTRGVVGYQYTVTDFDGNTWPSPQPTGEAAPDLVNVRLENDAQQQVWRREAAERRMAQRTELQPLYDELDKLTKGLSLEGRDALLDLVRRRVWSRWSR